MKTVIPLDLLQAHTCAGCLQPIGLHKVCGGLGRANPTTPCDPAECQSGWQRADHAKDCHSRGAAVATFVAISGDAPIDAEAAGLARTVTDRRLAGHPPHTA